MGGSLPTTAVATVLKDLPTLTGRLRNTYYICKSLEPICGIPLTSIVDGFPPYILHDSSAPAPSIQQTEVFHFGPSKSNVHEPLPNDKHWHLHMIGKEHGHFSIHYDTKTMYAQEGGVHATVFGAGKAGISIVNDGNGLIKVQVGEAADGKKFEIVVHPIGTSVVAPNS